MREERIAGGGLLARAIEAAAIFGADPGHAMVSRVAGALVVHELLERTRDRWVLVISVVFAGLASAVSLYGQSAQSDVRLTGPSLVTLASLLVPLVALVLGHDAIVGERERNTLGMLLSLPVRRHEVVVAKFLGRALALAISVTAGLGAATLFAGGGETTVLMSLLGPTLLLGLAFLSLGMLISAAVTRQVTAASLVVVCWFLLVFFYDLALLGVMVASDGAFSQEAVSALTVGNPAGLYRLQMMGALAGPEVLEGLGLAVLVPGPTVTALVWSAWIVGPLALSGLVLSRTRAFR